MEESTDFVSFFADDGALIAAGIDFKEVSENLGKAMKIVREYCKKWQLKLSETKCEIMPLVPPVKCEKITTKETKEISENLQKLKKQACYGGIDFGTIDRSWPKPEVDIENLKVFTGTKWLKPKKGKTVIVLGLEFDCTMSFRAHILSTYSKGLKRLAILHHLFKPKLGVGTYEKIMMVENWLIPSVLYAGGVWDLARPRDKDLVDSLIFQGYKKALNAPKETSHETLLHEIGKLDPS